MQRHRQAVSGAFEWRVEAATKRGNLAALLRGGGKEPAHRQRGKSPWIKQLSLGAVKAYGRTGCGQLIRRQQRNCACASDPSAPLAAQSLDLLTSVCAIRQDLAIRLGASLAEVFAVDPVNGQLCLTANGHTWRLTGLAACDLQLLQSEKSAAEKRASKPRPRQVRPTAHMSCPGGRWWGCTETKQLREAGLSVGREVSRFSLRTLFCGCRTPEPVDTPVPVVPATPPRAPPAPAPATPTRAPRKRALLCACTYRWARSGWRHGCVEGWLS